MAAIVLTDAALWIGAYSLQGITNSLAMSLMMDAVEVTAFGNTARASIGGLRASGLQVEGFWDAANDLGVHGTLLGASYPVTVSPFSTVGSIAYNFNAVSADYKLGAQVGDAFKFSAGAQGNSKVSRGMLMENSTRITTANGTGQNLGAISATQKLYSALHVTAASVADTLDIIIQSDDNSGFTTPTTRATLAQITAAGSVMTEISGAITDTWWRYVFTIGGSSPSFTIAGSMGIA